MNKLTKWIYNVWQIKKIIAGVTSLYKTKLKLMINKNVLPLWFTSIQLHPAMKGLSDKTLISSPFKTVSESNPLASSVFWYCHNFRKVPGAAHPHCCLGTEGSQEVCSLALQHLKDRTAQNGIHVDWDIDEVVSYSLSPYSLQQLVPLPQGRLSKALKTFSLESIPFHGMCAVVAAVTAV